jgi:PAS domain S-box-containing protein
MGTMMKTKILVIDDEEGMRFTFNKFLSDREYEVSTASDFDEALASISKTDYDVIFADIILKGKTGIDVLREVKKRNLNSPVVIITGYPDIETASEAVRLGAFDYIPKPVRKEELLRVTNAALQYRLLVKERERYRTNLEAIFKSVKDAIITVDNELRIIEINEAAKKICGITRDDIGRDFNSLPKTCRRNCFEYLLETIHKRQPLEIFRLECQTKKGLKQVSTISTSPLIDHHNNFSGAVMIVKDETRLTDLERELRERQQFHKLIGKNKKMQEIYSLIELLADVETTVLITGESGTGKELVAEALHYTGNRRLKPLVKVSCSALSEHLLESELFGHVRGAFTGAIKDKIGRFQIADGGTIFLDEIGDISLRIQSELLRVLEEKEFERVGDHKTIKVDVRVIAATNQDLLKKVKLGEFRQDLYYRLNVIKMNLPPLRERRDDIPLLVEHFINKFNKKFNKEITGVSDNVQKLFMNYPWPGNVRELEHTMEHAFILCNQFIITFEHLPSEVKSFAKSGYLYLRDKKTLNTQAILNALKKTAWNKTKAARMLGISRRSLYRKIKEYNIINDEL